MTTFEEFEHLSRTFNTVPLAQTMLADMLTPVSAYITLREAGSPSFLFESVEPDEKLGRHSFVGIDPTMILKSKGKIVEITEGEKHSVREESIFDLLASISARFHQGEVPGVSGFAGGLVGFLGYDCVRLLEEVPAHPVEPPNRYDAIFCMFPTVIRFDHFRQLVTIVHNIIVNPDEQLPRQYERGKQKLETIGLRLRKSTNAAHTFACDCSHVRDDPEKRSFMDAVARAKEYILNGDIFQVVLSRSTRLPFSGDPFSVYRALRIINPSPYLFYLDYGETKLIGSSPEVLVRVRNREVELLPIAGTRRRGQTGEEDARLEADLLRDEKELAEHVMLVDLGRNDVGRISDFGSVEVPVFKRVERYSHVMHIVSHVRGVLKAGLTAIDALKACFPAGTVSGAPKIRAMEIINELEKSGRGIYAGAVGYIGFQENIDTCIAIRTIIVHGNTLYVQSGAGIVADSVAEREYDETVSKAQAMFDAISLAVHGLKPSSSQSAGA